MNNYASETFAYVMKLKAAATTSDFYEAGMRENYLLEEPGEAYNKYRVGTEWVEMEPTEINKLPIGAMFIGVCRRDSMARNYVVIAKDQSGNAVWFPLDTSASQVVQISEFNEATRKFEPKFKGEMSTILMKMETMCEVGKFYLSTDINGFKLPLHDTDEDDDELDELSDEDQEVLDRLKDELEDLDDDDDDEDDFDDDDEDHDVEILSECVFLCYNVRGTKEFITVGTAIKMDDEINELKQHLEKYTAKAQSMTKTMQAELEDDIKINDVFSAAFPRFMELSGMNKGMEDSEDAIDISIPASSDEYDDVLNTNTDTKPVTIEVADIKQHKSEIDVEDVKADTDGDDEQPKDYEDPADSVSPDDEAVAGDAQSEPFGANESKWDGPAEYDDAKPSKQDFGDW